MQVTQAPLAPHLANLNTSVYNTVVFQSFKRSITHSTTIRKKIKENK
uniref:Uncharacterized protein n=1 Tax=Arundo donax TaxID=35708 RepID=A0A0A9F7A2_ARUDO